MKRNISYWISFLSSHRKDTAIGVLIAFSIIATFYTSFFRHPENLVPAIKDTVPYVLFTSETSVGHHKPFSYFTDLLVQYELPILAFALLGLLFFRRNLYTKFSTYLFVSTWLMFSVVAYKTPWNIVHVTLPMALVAGIGAQEIYRKLGRYAIPLFAIVVIYTAWVSYNVNYIDHSGQFNQLAYVTTAPDFLDMVNRIYTYDKNSEIKVQSPDHWPLAWYLRDYKRVGYYGQILDDPDADIIIIKKEDKEKLEPKLNRTYESADYQLRWGVWLSAFYARKVSSI